MESLNLCVKSIYTRGVHLPPDAPVNEKSCVVDCYEIILFPDDYDGGIVIDGVFYQAATGYFVCCKPTQQRRYKLPVGCYVIGVSTQDTQLKASLDALPTCLHYPDMDQLIELYWKIYYIPTHTDLPDRLELYTHLAAFLRKMLLKEYPLGIVIPAKPRRHREVLLAADQYLKDHLEENVDLEKLAEASHLHPTYFHKLFTEAFGRSPAQQLMLHRIRASWEYLRKDDCTIAEVARKCGFSSQSYFCRKYKEISKETPSHFRQAMRKRRKKQMDTQ